ncbi:KpsF/GutQ family sugar-phosphate isomerase [Granulosicoccaceae sp. 1_MG-2023]|nr:KpsF/GutQ family sugar-phosphate isomerase [Granulosicoccaceae sp. 1_MG-2023]
MSVVRKIDAFPGSRHSFLDTAIESLKSQASALNRIAANLGDEFDQAVNAILGCTGRVIVSGMGKSGLVGKKVAATFASTGTPSFYIHPGEAIHGDLGMITHDDLVVLISNSGETEEVIRLLPSLKYFGNRIIGIAGDEDSTLARESDIFIRADIEREVCPNNLAPTTSTLVAMAVGDALAVSLIKARDFKPADFAQFHPGGRLGRRLLARVRDVMQKERLPVISIDTSIRDAIFRMTSGRLGLAIVMEGSELRGIITDGDLRRALLRDASIMDKRVDAYMSPAPVTIPADAMLTDAEALMRKHKIRALVVTDPDVAQTDKVCGILEIFSETDC